MTTLAARTILQAMTVTFVGIGASGCSHDPNNRQNGHEMMDHSKHSGASTAVALEIGSVNGLTAGKATDLTFKLQSADEVLRRSDLAETHEKLLHFVVVDEGLTDFSHLHPTLGDEGTWTQSVKLQHGGQYVVFAEGQLAKGGSFVARKEIKAAGDPSNDSAGFEVSLRSKAGTSEAKILNPKALMTEMDSSVRVQVSPADGWEPYLGAPGHLILINKEGMEFVHAHPTKMEGGLAEFHAAFKKPGPYRAWAQFQRGGRVLTFPFTIEVNAGESGHSEKHSGH